MNKFKALLAAIMLAATGFASAQNTVKISVPTINDGFVPWVDTFKKDRKLSDTVRATAKNWQYMMNTTNAGEAYFRKSVKRYLFDHVRSQFIRIDSDEYQKAVQLPLEEWVYKR